MCFILISILYKHPVRGDAVLSLLSVCKTPERVVLEREVLCVVLLFCSF